MIFASYIRLALEAFPARVTACLGVPEAVSLEDMQTGGRLPIDGSSPAALETEKTWNQRR